MSEIVELIKSIPDVAYIEGCTDDQIAEAEKELGLKFPQEYVDYVKAFGCVDFFGHELTGLNVTGRLNVAVATQKEKNINDSFPNDSFVLENLGIDAKIVLLNTNGEVILLQNDQIKVLFSDLIKYIKSCI